eukprot:GFUD01028635.1.p1 GENE.GFUD01028635.1~~GFUD01028635.1.p1  ORF type:complete len:421 (+),score=80.89 GFUD01028635.1:75-1265(+)
MGRLRLFNIRLDKPSGVYFGGDVITGTVSLGLDGNGKKARGVHLTLKGKSKVHWTTRSNKKTRHHRSEENYVNDRSYVIGDGSNEMQIEAGDHEFPFQFQLPLNIPSSFAGKYGKIVYNITAVVDRPWRFDHETVAFFTVVGIYDLNLDPKAMNPQSLSDHKTLCCLCCTTGPISATVKVDRSGYVPGETIFLQALADNKSSRIMTKTVVRLVQKITFKANRRDNVEEYIIFEYKKGAIAPGESDSWHDTALKIPTLPPSDLPYCNNIVIRYTLEFRVEPSGAGFDLKLKVPIVIGTIPLRSTFNQFASIPKIPSAPPPKSEDPYVSAPPASKFPDAPPPFSAYPELPPPSYEQAVGDNFPNLRDEEDEEHNEHAGGNWDFRPLYPSYAGIQRYEM